MRKRVAVEEGGGGGKRKKVRIGKIRKYLIAEKTRESPTKRDSVNLPSRVSLTIRMNHTES